MKFTIEYPVGDQGSDPRFVSGTTLTRFAQQLETAGFSALAFTDHPAASHKWLAAGGHDTFDPLVALGACALVTERLHLMTNLLVLAYRNPFLTAKAAATVDVLSDGRLILVVGAGYLRSEYNALGVPFDERNALFDEYLDLLPRLWQEEDLRFEGTGYRAGGQTQRPRPVQRPHPPIWIGGNSPLTRRRVARSGQGWSPQIQSEQMAAMSRTVAFTSVAELKIAIQEIRDLRTAAGRGEEHLDVHVALPTPRAGLDSYGGPLPELIDELRDAGVTWAMFSPAIDDVDRCMDEVARFGEDVISVHGPA